MKKLSTIIALALIVTIGSVYAAWNYAQGTTASNEVTREINMAQVNTDSNKGSIAVTPDDVLFLVDDAGGYLAKLTGEGEFLIKFNPAVGADPEVIASGIKMKAIVTIQGAKKYDYNGEDITPVAAKNGSYEITLNGGKACLETKLLVSDILAGIDFCLNESGEVTPVYLRNKTENDRFHTAIKDYTIYITISEIV